MAQVGDAKEPVRKGVRALFRELCSFYPPGKLFNSVLDGLKSKNARQRTGQAVYCTNTRCTSCLKARPLKLITLSLKV